MSDWPLRRAHEMFECVPDCPVCDGEGAVCENHPDMPWRETDGCVCGAGAPCPEIVKRHA